jgi:hypothetical protein
MAKTYEPIATNTVSGTSTSTITFSSIPSTYTDLILVFQAQVTDAYALFRVNGNSSSLYSRTDFYGNGSSAASNRGTNETTWYPSTGGSSVTGTGIVHIMNYANTTTNKTALIRNDVTNGLVDASAWLWRSTAAITSISLAVPAANNWIAGSTFTLYGIKAA